MMILDFNNHLCEALVLFPLFNESHTQSLYCFILSLNLISLLNYFLFELMNLLIFSINFCLKIELHIN
jgi:hypothetical protein